MSMSCGLLVRIASKAANNSSAMFSFSSTIGKNHSFTNDETNVADVIQIRQFSVLFMQGNSNRCDKVNQVFCDPIQLTRIFHMNQVTINQLI